MNNKQQVTRSGSEAGWSWRARTQIHITAHGSRQLQAGRQAQTTTNREDLLCCAVLCHRRRAVLKSQSLHRFSHPLESGPHRSAVTYKSVSCLLVKKPCQISMQTLDSCRPCKSTSRMLKLYNTCVYTGTLCFTSNMTHACYI